MITASNLGANTVQLKKCALLMDSNPERRALRKKIMALHGVEMIGACDLDEAASIWHQDRYDMVLIDIRKDYSGALALRDEIKKDSPGQMVAFLVGKPDYVSFDPAPGSYVPEAARNGMGRSDAKGGAARLRVAATEERIRGGWFPDCQREATQWSPRAGRSSRRVFASLRRKRTYRKGRLTHHHASPINDLTIHGGTMTTAPQSRARTTRYKTRPHARKRRGPELERFGPRTVERPRADRIPRRRRSVRGLPEDVVLHPTRLFQLDLQLLRQSGLVERPLFQQWFSLPRSGTLVGVDHVEPEPLPACVRAQQQCRAASRAAYAGADRVGDSSTPRRLPASRSHFAPEASGSCKRNGLLRAGSAGLQPGDVAHSRRMALVKGPYGVGHKPTL